MNLLDLNLTEQDFDMILEGLDEIPNKGAMGNLLSGLVGGMITKDNPEARAEMQRQQENERRKEEDKKRQIKEDVSLLKGKLVMLKRYLSTQGALKQVDDIINPL